MELVNLGDTGIRVSPLGLGSVKFGRNQGVKYPQHFEIPSDREVTQLLGLAQESGINLLDTAPAYGVSEERLGKLLPGSRHDWVIASKAGENFAGGESRFDYSAAATRASIEATLRRLKTDYLDMVLIHSDGDDERIFAEEEVLDTLELMKHEGWIRAHGLSGKTVAGGLEAVRRCDVLMVTCNTAYNDELPVLEAAREAGKGVLIKKALQSGHIDGTAALEEAFAFVYAQPGVSSVIIGTINPKHLRDNVAIVRQILEA